MQRTRSHAGLTILEVVVAMSLLAVISLGLMAMVSSSQQLTIVGREKNAASNAIRSYIESMRSKTAAQIMADTTTPANFVPVVPRPSGTSKSGAADEPVPLLREVNGEVFKINFEDGTRGTLVEGGPTGGTATANAFWSNCYDPLGRAGSAPYQQNESSRLGFDPGLPGRDLDGDGSPPLAAPGAHNPVMNAADLKVIPARVRLTWRSGSESRGAGKVGSYQDMVVYVCFTGK